MSNPSADEPMGREEAAVWAEFERFIETPRGQELRKELCALHELEALLAE